MNKIGVWVAGWLLVVGCEQPQRSPSLHAVVAPTMLTTNQVIQIAKGAVAKNDAWAERATYEAKHLTNGWSVMVWRIEGHDANGKAQFVFGGHRLVQIDDQGEVKNYIRGR